MKTDKQLIERITLLIDQAIESEVGYVREFTPETDAILAEISKELIDRLNLPDNFHL